MKKILTALLFFISTTIWAQIPQTISFQGVLIDPADGQAVADGNYDFIFSIYNAASGGLIRWTETQSLTTSDGHYSAILGSITPVDITGSESYWLEINVNTIDLGRVELTSAVYLLDDDLEILASTGNISGNAATATIAGNVNGTVAVVNGGTGATTEGDARTNLGLSIGTDIQAYNTNLSDLSDGSLSGSKVGGGINAANITTGTLGVSHLGSDNSFGSSSGQFRDAAVTFHHPNSTIAGGFAIKNDSHTGAWAAFATNDGSALIFYSVNSDGSYNGNVQLATTGVTWSSDRRLKKDIQELNYGLNEILELKPVSYQLRGPSDNKRKLGLIAQDVHKVVDELVQVPESNEEYLSLNYMGLIPVLIKAMQEQQEQIEELKLKINALQDKEESSKEKTASRD